MKKYIALILCLSVFLSLCACGGNENETTPDGQTNPTADAVLSDGELDTGMKEKFDQMEYSAYVDLFYNDNGASYEGKNFQKDGTFAVLKDAYNDTTRYYVWGYADNTKCCDYQWEFVLPEGVEIPEPGSYIKVAGKMVKSDKALDGYWLENVSLEVTDEFRNAGFDMDLTTMSPTLVRVQIINLLQHKDKFADLSIRLFGRALTPETIQHPYYNESWQMHFTKTDISPAIGDYILIEGTYNKASGGTIIATDKLSIIG